GRQSIAKQVWPGTLSQQIDDLPPPAGVTAASPAQGFAQGASENVDSTHDVVKLVGATSSPPHKTDGVRIVHHHQGAVMFSQVADARQVGDVTIHGEHPIRRNQSEARVSGLFQLALQIFHAVVAVTEALRFSKPNAVNNTGVV